MSEEWLELDKNKIPVDTMLEFLGHDWSKFICKGMVKVSSEKSPKKYRNKRKFYTINKRGDLEPDRGAWLNVTHYREIK